MEPKTGKPMVSKIPVRKKTVVVHRGGTKEQSSFDSVIVRWLVTMSVCLVIWAVLSPLFYEQFYLMAGRKGTGHFTDWLFSVACFLVPLLLVSISSTRKVIVKTRDQYFPPTDTNNADLPARQTLVRASSEPMQVQQAVLLRAATEGQETPAEQLVRASVGQD